MIEISEYRPLPRGKVERIYAPTPVEPPGDDPTPENIARLLGAVLDATRADLNSACLAKEDGEQREVWLLRTTRRLSNVRRAELQARLEKLIQSAGDGDEDEEEGEGDEDDGIYTRIVVTMLDLADQATTAISLTASTTQAHRRGQATYEPGRGGPADRPSQRRGDLPAPPAPAISSRLAGREADLGTGA